MLYLPLQLLWCHLEGYQWRVKMSEDRLLTGCLMFSKLMFISSYNQSVSLQYTQYLLMTPAIRNSLESCVHFWFRILAYFQTLPKKETVFHQRSRHQNFITGLGFRLQKRFASECFFHINHMCSVRNWTKHFIKCLKSNGSWRNSKLKLSNFLAICFCVIFNPPLL